MMIFLANTNDVFLEIEDDAFPPFGSLLDFLPTLLNYLIKNMLNPKTMEKPSSFSSNEKGTSQNT